MQTFDDLVQEIKLNLAYHKTDKEIAKYLLDNNAITKTGAINCDYPKLFISHYGDDISIDEGGDLLGLKTLKEKSEKEGKFCRIEYVPRFYSAFLEARRQIDFKI